jgi:hypothetical protein
MSAMSPTASSGSSAPARVVLFLTTPSASDIPLSEPQPACLLPLGHASFAERVLDSCAQAGLREIDLVASDQPERLRALLGDGWRWGLRLRWHLAKDSTTPYSLLRTLQRLGADSLLLGHAHCWLDAAALRQLLAAPPSLALAPEGVEDWTGWARIKPEQLDDLSCHADEDSLAQLLLRRINSRLELSRRQWAWAGSAAELLAAQSLGWPEPDQQPLPATWIRQPWGAVHPEAHVHPQARIEGPVLIGPRCLVEGGATLGPHTVLTADVLVAGGAVVRQALILPNTYVSGQVTLDHVLAQGNAVQHLGWNARTTLAPTDGLLTELSGRPPAKAGWLARALALVVLLAAAPLALLLQLWQALRSRPGGWRLQHSVLGRNPTQGTLQMVALRCAHQGAGFSGWLLGRYGALLDILQGRRRWFGVRARTPAQWYALRRDWQQLFEQQAVGFFHAPVWREPGQADDLEAQAAADAFLSVQTGWQMRWQMLAVLLRSFSIAALRSPG